MNQFKFLSFMSFGQPFHREQVDFVFNYVTTFIWVFLVYLSCSFRFSFVNI